MSLVEAALVLVTDIHTIRAEIIAKGMHIGSHADDIIDKRAFMIPPSNTQISLVVKAVSELGFEGRANFEEICVAANRIGLVKCPAKVGPLLRLHYTEQPLGEWIIVAMDSIIDSKGEPRMFLVGHNDRGLWLVGDHGYPRHSYGHTKKFVFAVSHE